MTIRAKNYGEPGYNFYLDEWQVAHNGKEPVTNTWTGKRVQYVYMPRTKEHAYLDLGTDLILSDAEVDYHVYRNKLPHHRDTK